MPISVYRVSKFSCGSLFTAYRHTLGVRGLIFRLANIVGDRSTHGVIVDFIRKLQKKPEELEILGDRNQSKSYSHVKDFIEAVFVALRGDLQELGSLHT